LNNKFVRHLFEADNLHDKLVAVVSVKLPKGVLSMQLREHLHLRKCEINPINVLVVTCL
jgi:hypothetical protein